MPNVPQERDFGPSNLGRQIFDPRAFASAEGRRIRSLEAGIKSAVRRVTEPLTQFGKRVFAEKVAQQRRDAETELVTATIGESRTIRGELNEQVDAGELEPTDAATAFGDRMAESIAARVEHADPQVRSRVLARVSPYIEGQVVAFSEDMDAVLDARKTGPEFEAQVGALVDGYANAQTEEELEFFENEIVGAFEGNAAIDAKLQPGLAGATLTQAQIDRAQASDPAVVVEMIEDGSFTDQFPLVQGAQRDAIENQARRKIDKAEGEQIRSQVLQFNRDIETGVISNLDDFQRIERFADQNPRMPIGTRNALRTKLLQRLTATADRQASIFRIEAIRNGMPGATTRPGSTDYQDDVDAWGEDVLFAEGSEFVNLPLEQQLARMFFEAEDLEVLPTRFVERLQGDIMSNDPVRGLQAAEGYRELARHPFVKAQFDSEARAQASHINAFAVGDPENAVRRTHELVGMDPEVKKRRLAKMEEDIRSGALSLRQILDAKMSKEAPFLRQTDFGFPFLASAPDILPPMYEEFEAFVSRAVAQTADLPGSINEAVDQFTLDFHPTEVGGPRRWSRWAPEFFYAASSKKTPSHVWQQAQLVEDTREITGNPDLRGDQIITSPDIFSGRERDRDGRAIPAQGVLIRMEEEGPAVPVNNPDTGRLWRWRPSIERASMPGKMLFQETVEAIEGEDRNIAIDSFGARYVQELEALKARARLRLPEGTQLTDTDLITQATMEGIRDTTKFLVKFGLDPIFSPAPGTLRPATEFVRRDLSATAATAQRLAGAVENLIVEQGTALGDVLVEAARPSEEPQ